MVSKSEFKVNVCNARHELALLQDIISTNHYQEVYIKDKQADLIWLFPGSKNYNNEMINNTKAIFNQVPGLSVVSNKRNAARVLTRMARYYPDPFNFIPETYCLPEQTQALELRMKQQDCTFIVKP
jgi:hypothetical protein